jgi:hypothetical protein
LDTLSIIEAINEAIQIVRHARKQLAGGSLTIWRMTDHAETHLDNQIRELLAA